MRLVSQLAQEPTLADIQQLVRATGLGPTQQFEALTGGAFGLIYAVRLAQAPHRAIVKVQRFPDRGRPEQRQLEVLRKHLSVPVPAIYAYHSATPEIPFEALLMEYIPGIAGRTLGELSPEMEAQIGQDVITLLQSLQSVRNPEGYGPLDGPFHKKWWNYYRQRVEAVYNFLLHDPNRAAFDKTVLDMTEQSIERGEEIFSDRGGVATLIHGDYSLGNIMFDPTTYQITGLIDPLEAEWGDPVQDAIHLTKSNGDRFRLVERYREVIGGGERFALHFWFYQFWTWLYYYALIDIDVKGWLSYCAQELQRAMKEYL